MKAFARLDVIIQVILIISGLALGLAVMTNSIHSDYMFFPYFLVGGWQIFSVIVHLVGEGTRIRQLRKIYLGILLFVILALLISLVTKEGIIYALFGLLIFSPFMAFFYLFTCYKELQVYQAKPGNDPIELVGNGDDGTTPANGPIVQNN